MRAGEGYEFLCCPPFYTPLTLPHTGSYHVLLIPCVALLDMVGSLALSIRTLASSRPHLVRPRVPR